LRVTREFAAGRCLFRGRNRRPFIARKHYGRRTVASRKLKDEPGNIILGVRGQAPCNLESLFQELRHVGENTPFGVVDGSGFWP
jgi:hypothetical protein